MNDELIGTVQCEIELINNELDFQTEKYMNIQKKLGEGSNILDRNKVLLNNLKKRTEMNEILKFMGMIVVVILIILSVRYSEYGIALFKKCLKFINSNK